jgi:hypothetical protein
MKHSKTRSQIFQDAIVFLQLALVLAAFLIQYFEQEVSLCLIRFGYFVQPKALSASCLATLVFLQGIYFYRIQKKKTGLFFLLLGAAILVVNLIHFIFE